jgi:Type II intron maturase
LTMPTGEMRGIAQYYVLASNFHTAIGKLRFLGTQSFLKTMGDKHQMSMQKVATMLNRGSYLAVREKGREVKLFRVKDVKRETSLYAEIDKPPLRFRYTNGSELLRRLNADTCEYCGKTGGYFEVHHIRKLADIKDGKLPWQKHMIARARKTIVLCIGCHDQLHAGTLPDQRHFQK